jgi:anti-sigma B factor antagonist
MISSDGISTTAVIQQREAEGVVVLSIRRSLKGEGETALRERVEALVRAGHTEILIDMSGMPYVDSSELGRLIRANISVRQAGGRVRLCNLSERVVALLKMTRLDTVLELYATEEEALANIRGNHAGRDRA